MCVGEESAPALCLPHRVLDTSGFSSCSSCLGKGRGLAVRGAVGMVCPSREECLITDMLESLVHGDNKKQRNFPWGSLFLHRQRST